MKRGMGPDSRWRWAAAIAALTLLGLALRFYRIGVDSYWLDEAISVLIARSSISAILSNAGRSSHPALYYLLLHFWTVLGTGEAWVRSFSALVGALTVPLVAVWGSVLFNRRVGLVSALLFALSPFHVVYSQEARMYILAACLGVAGLLCFCRAMRDGTRRWWIVTGAAMALAMLTHLFAGWLLAAMNLYALVYQRDRRTWMWLLLVDLVALGVVAPHGLGMLADSQPELGGLRPLANEGARPSLLFPFTAVRMLLVGYSLTRSWAIVSLVGSLLIFAFTLLEVGGAFWRREGDLRSLTLLLLVTGAVLLGPFALALIRPIFLPERTLTLGLPALVVLVAWGIAGTGRRTPLPFLGIGLAAIMVFSLRGYYFDPDFRKPPLREAAVFVHQRFEDGDAILHTSDASYLVALTGAHPAESFLLAGDPDPRKPEAVYELWGGRLVERDGLEPGFQRLWLVVALEHSLDFQRDALTWFENRYVKLEQHSVGGIGVYLFDLTEKVSDEGL